MASSVAVMPNLFFSSPMNWAPCLTVVSRGWICGAAAVATVFKALAAAFTNDVRWQGVPTALGDTNEMATLHVVPNLTVVSSLLTPLHAPTVQPCEVTVRRLDELFPSLLTAIPALIIMALSVNLLGDWLRDALNPKLR